MCVQAWVGGCDRGCMQAHVGMWVSTHVSLHMCMHAMITSNAVCIFHCLIKYLRGFRSTRYGKHYISHKWLCWLASVQLVSDRQAKFTLFNCVLCINWNSSPTDGILSIICCFVLSLIHVYTTLSMELLIQTKLCLCKIFVIFYFCDS